MSRIVQSQRMNAPMMLGILLSSVELALTLINARNEDAFRLNSYTSLVFCMSAVSEVIGFVYAICLACLWRGRCHVVGSPLILIWGARSAGSEARPETSEATWWKAIGVGLVLQCCGCSLCFFQFIDEKFKKAEPDVGEGVALLVREVWMDVWALFVFAISRNKQWLPYLACVSVPILVLISECILILSYGSNLASSYLLAFLVLIIAVPAVFFLAKLTPVTEPRNPPLLRNSSALVMLIGFYASSVLQISLFAVSKLFPPWVGFIYLMLGFILSYRGVHRYLGVHRAVDLPRSLWQLGR